MALDFSEFQKLIESATKADSTKADLKKALKKVESALTGLQVALGDIEHIISDDYQPQQKEKRTYKKKEAPAELGEESDAPKKKAGRPKKAKAEELPAE